MPCWRTVRYIQDYHDPGSCEIRSVGLVERMLEPLALQLCNCGVVEFTDANGRTIWDPIPENILPESVAIAPNSSDNVVMSDSQATLFPTVAPEIGNFTHRVFVPSPQQEAGFQWVETGTGHAIMIAVAGAGKTTTLIECFKRIVKTGKKVVFLAFNNKIAAEIREKVIAAGLQGNVEIKTFHAYGMKIWFRANQGCKLEGEDPGNAGYMKFDRILEELAPANGPIPYMYKTFVRKAWTFARQSLFGFEINLMDKDAWLKLVEHHDLDDDIAEIAEEDGMMLSTTELQEHVGNAINWTVRVIRKGIELSREVVDFEDVIYMPLVAQIHVWQNDWVLVDEAQDTNPSRRAFVAKILKPTGRSMWVGDPAQAIYGFTGADSKSLDIIRERFGAETLHLTVTYRCPKLVVQKAQQWVSHIEAHESAPEGTLKTINVADILKEGLRQDVGQDVILCRNNKPLADLALALIKRGVPCHVEGKDIGEGLCKLVNRWKSVRTIDQLVKTLEKYRDREVQKAMARGREQKAETISDQVETLLAIIADMPRGSSLEDLDEKVSAMFLVNRTERRPTLTLSSIHKAKGREWNRVFWYGPAKFQPSKYARKDWQREQERNLMYVAVTRTKDTLVTVTVPEMPGKITFSKNEEKVA